MTSKKPTDIAASIKARLLNRARSDGVNFNLYLIRYANERLLYRLARSAHADDFVLKGAMLFVAWSDLMFRPTADLDLLGYGADSINRFESIFRDLAMLDSDVADGLIFDPSSVRAIPIRDEQEYQGKRVVMSAWLGNIPIKLQIDIGIGDIITPGPQSLKFPSLLTMPHIPVRASTRETVVAEKLHVMVSRGLLNSRLKDYFDIWILQKMFSFDAELLHQALAATFVRRRTELPQTTPAALTDAFAAERSKLSHWKRITTGTEAAALTLQEAIAAIMTFIQPVLIPGPPAHWPPGGPWIAEP